MKKLDKRFGSRLSAVMARHGVSHRTLADYCGVTARSVSNWVSGHKPPLPILRLFETFWNLHTRQYVEGQIDAMPEPGNVLPNAQPQPEPVRVVEEVQS